MAAPMAKNVLIGSENGILKFLDVGRKSWANVNQDGKPDRSQEISTICWKDSSKSEAIFGLKNRKIKIFNLEDENIIEQVQVPGEKKLVGLCVCGDKFVSGLSNGIVNVWNYEDESPLSEYQVGDLHRLKSSPYDPSIFATGGKENDLKLWDLNSTGEPKFHAKNVPHDWLELRVPIWVTDMQFLDTQKVVVCTGYHQIRIYDQRGPQRRPVLNFSYGEYPFTCMTLVNENQVVVGDTVGKMALMDLRKSGSMVQLYKEFAGGVTSIGYHERSQCLVSTSLDRFVRVHDLQSKKLLHKFYMKSRLKSLLLSPDEWIFKTDEDSEKKKKSRKRQEVEEDSDNENQTDELWDKLQTTEKKKSSKDDSKIKKKKKMA